MGRLARVALALLIFALPMGAKAAVAFDAATQGANKVNTSTNDTIAHTSGGSANYGIVLCSFDDVTEAERSADSVLWGGNAMSKQQDHDEGRSSTEIWVLANPLTGAQNVVIDPGSTGTTNFQCWAVSLTGVDTASAIVDMDGLEDATSPSEVTVDTVADGLVLDVMQARSGTALDSDASQGNELLSGTVAGMSTKAGNGSPVTMAWTYTTASGNRSHSAISVRAATAGGSAVPLILQQIAANDDDGGLALVANSR
jgi:hypothetical protein